MDYLKLWMGSDDPIPTTVMRYQINRIASRVSGWSLVSLNFPTFENSRQPDEIIIRGEFEYQLFFGEGITAEQWTDAVEFFDRR